MSGLSGDQVAQLVEHVLIAQTLAERSVRAAMSLELSDSMIREATVQATEANLNLANLIASFMHVPKTDEEILKKAVEANLAFHAGCGEYYSPLKEDQDIKTLILVFARSLEKEV